MSQRWIQFIIGTALLLAVCLPSAHAATFKLPAHESYQLPNGLKVYLMPQREVPLLHVTLAVRAGSIADGDQLGLASLTSDSLILGTKERSKDELENFFDFHGAALEAGSNQDYSALNMSLAAKDAGALMPVFAAMVRTPTFPEAEVNKLRDRRIFELKKAQESPNEVADQFFNHLLFVQHPYAQPVNGTPTSLGKLRRADLERFHGSWYRPQHAAISVVGDMDIPAMKKLVEQHFATWAAASSATQAKAPDALAPQMASGRVLVVNKSDARETTFRIGGKGVKRDDRDWIALQVLNTILGGRFTSLLNEELRVKSGLTYGARSRFEGFKSAGTFSIASFTATENTAKALELALRTYKGFIKNGVDEASLSSAKAYVKGQFPPRYETSQALSGLLVQMWIYDLPATIIDNFEAEVSDLSLSRANDVLKKHFPADGLNILLIGQAAKIQDLAKSYGRVDRAEIGAALEGRI